MLEPTPCVSVPLSKEERDLQADMKRLRAISNPYFLKIDDSDLPIEYFDSLEFEENDKPPEHWLKLRTNGKPQTGVVPFYRDGWKWKNCEVVSYDADEKKFEVRIRMNTEDSFTKNVSRLNICFDKENKDIWKERRNFALKGRESAKARLRYDYYISKRSGKDVAPIQKPWLRNIQALVSDGLPSYVPFPERGTHSEALLRALTRGVINDFSRCMKRALVSHEIATKSEVAAEYDSLKLPKIDRPPPAPPFGKVSIPASLAPFETIRRAFARKHYTRRQELVNSLNFQVASWESETMECLFMDTTLKNLELPCKLKDLHLAEQSQCVDLTKRLQKRWRHVGLEKIIDELQDVFDFFESEVNIYESGGLKRFIRVVELRMSGALRCHVVDSLQAWLSFIASYTASDTSVESWETPLLKIDLGVHATDVVTIPSLSEIQSVMTQVIHTMVDNVRSINALEAEIMSLLARPQQVLLNICRGDAICRDIDVMISNALTTIEMNVESAMQPVHLLAKKYQKFSYIMEIDAIEMVTSLAQAQPPPTAEEYVGKIREFYSIILKIESDTSDDEEYFKLMKVNTLKIKHMLVKKAKDLRDALCDHVMFTERGRLTEIGELYMSMLERMKVRPKNETQLKELKDFIKDSNEIILSTVEEVVGIHKRLDVLSEFGVIIPKDLSDLKWSTMLYPQKVERAYLKKDEEIESDQIKFLDKLALEKENFEALLEKFQGDVDRSKALDDYESQAKIVEEINDVVDALAEAVLQKYNFNEREAVFNMPPTDCKFIMCLWRINFISPLCSIFLRSHCDCQIPSS